MLKKLCEILEGVIPTVISGVFLAASLILTLTNTEILINPAWVTVIISGFPLIYSAIRKLIFGKGLSRISSALLISVAMTAAIIINDLFAAAEVAFIMAIGEILEDMTTDRAKKGLKKLIDLAPALARRITENGEELISADKIQVGDILRVLPGETIPADGEILSGETSVDQSVLTGESLPVDKSAGDTVFCGTLNRFGSADIRVLKPNTDTSLQKLIRMVKDAENKKAPMQRIADKWASILVPVAFLIAIVSFIITRNTVTAVTVLVVFCPCALVLATPTAIMAAIGQATRHGVIIKSGEALENLAKTDTVTFDKTGTLTNGKLTVSDIICFDTAFTDTEILSFSAAAESRSEHPLGVAVTGFAKTRGISVPDISDFKMTAGGGVAATVLGRQVLCGNEKYLRENGAEIPSECITETDKLQRDGKALVFVCIDNKLSGLIALSDTLRESSAETVKKLADLKVDSVLLTGDNLYAAQYFASKTGISQIYSNLLPEQKVEKISELQKQGKNVCMIGDGINDAPALKTANVGISLSSIGSDIAVDAADIALMSDDISRLPYLKRLACGCVNTIKLSITLSLIINFAAIVLSLLGLLNPTTGALVHNAGSVFVVLLAALLYDRKFD